LIFEFDISIKPSCLTNFFVGGNGLGVLFGLSLLKTVFLAFQMPNQLIFFQIGLLSSLFIVKLFEQ
jgi:hypothetical protein